MRSSKCIHSMDTPLRRKQKQIHELVPQNRSFHDIFILNLLAKFQH
uniref:Uncharacterized protein n=1 Tax=Rhizophora mucronata TaxID=61149 RepID=A0A2P2QBS1_RHIMU